jgi:hypothetical protein
MDKRKFQNRQCVLAIDANILVQDFWLEGKYWDYLSKRKFLSHKLIISEIAFAEAEVARFI